MKLKSNDLILQLAKKYKTPRQVQKYLRTTFSYNKKDTLYSALSCAKAKSGHCMEASLLAAAILEQHGYPPLLLSFESVDDLDHTLYVFQEKGLWGSIGKSRDEGLHGRAPVYRSLRDLTWSYFDHYVDHSGKITAYQVFDLREVDKPNKPSIDWRRSPKSLWKLEDLLLELKHIKLKSSHKRFRKLRELYLKNGALPIRRSFW